MWEISIGQPLSKLTWKKVIPAQTIESEGKEREAGSASKIYNVQNCVKIWTTEEQKQIKEDSNRKEREPSQARKVFTYSWHPHSTKSFAQTQRFHSRFHWALGAFLPSKIRNFTSVSKTCKGKRPCNCSKVGGVWWLGEDCAREIWVSGHRFEACVWRRSETGLWARLFKYSKNRIQPDFGQVSSCQRVKEGRGPQVLCSSSLQKNTDANRRQTEIWYMAFWKTSRIYFWVSFCVQMLAAVNACVAEAIWPVWPIGIVDQFGLTVLILGFPLPVDVALIRLWLYMIYCKHATCIWHMYLQFSVSVQQGPRGDRTGIFKTANSEVQNALGAKVKAESIVHIWRTVCQFLTHNRHLIHLRQGDWWTDCV